MRRWKLEDAKNRFSEVVRLAMANGPQRVTRGGRDAVVIVGAAEYEALVAPENLVDFLRASPLAKSMASGALTVERSRELPRDVPL
jgi:prevent-host-death family protein